MSPPRSRPNGKTILGWREVVALPAWGIDAIQAKVDTGARTCALHVEDIQPRPDGMVEFTVVVRREPELRQTVRAPVSRTTRVRSSQGVARERYVVRTVLRIGHVEREVEVGLVSRHRLRYRMLIGRKALGHDFLVDPSIQHPGTSERTGRVQP